MTTNRNRPWGVLLAVAVALLVAVPLVVFSGRPHARGPVPPPLGPPVNSTLELGGYLGTHYANPFYAVLLSDSGLPTGRLTSIGSFLNSTPITWVRFGGNGTGYDPVTETNYVPPAGGGTYEPVSTMLWNLTWFKSWCLSRSPHCLWLAFLPGEVNSSAYDLETAEWYHEELGLPPTLWQVGNEPTGWTHYGKNLSSWSTYDDLGPTNLDYAVDARNAIAAVTSVFPSDRFVGLEASCGCDSGEATAAAQLLGPSVAAMAFHGFPWSTDGSDVAAMLGGLTDTTNLTNEAARFRAAISAGCADCAGVPVEVGAYQAGPAGSLSPLSSGYAGAPFLAASVIQAIYANISMFTVFSTDSLLDSSTGTPLPEGLLYQRVLENMTMGNDYAVGVNAAGVGGVFSLLVRNATHESLLLVNSNVSYSLNLTVPASVFPVGTEGSEWLWGPQSATPQTTRELVLPTTYSVPSEGILLLDNY